MARFGLLTVCCLCFCLVNGFQWTSTLRNGQVLYACSGQNVTIPWSFSLSSGERIHSVEWLYRGRSEEVVAMFQHNIFLTLPAFSQRVQYVANGGLILHHVTPGDSGNYSVDIATQDSSGTFFTKFHSIILAVTDGLPTANGQLQVTQQPHAILDPSSQLWSIVLTCGNFTYVTQPPFPVEWLLPSGQALASSDYSDGRFELYLSSPVLDGSYTCRVPAQHLDAACLKDKNDTGAEGSTTVDGTAATMTLMAAELAGLKQLHTEQIHQLEDTVESLSNLTQSQQAAIDQLETELQEHLNDWECATDPCLDGYTVIDDVTRDVSYYTLGYTNCDNHLVEGWYRFLLNGNNAIIPTSCVPCVSTYNFPSRFVHEGQFVCSWDVDPQEDSNNIPQDDHCNTNAPYWLDLQGQASPSPGRQIQVLACGHDPLGCCYWNVSAIMRNCGEYFVYRLKPVDGCHEAYCAQIQE